MTGEPDQEPAAPEPTTKESMSPFSVPLLTKQIILNIAGRLKLQMSESIGVT